MNAARRYLIRGLVQGVGFRSFVHRRAIDFEIEGWVRNLPDGRVEAFGQGSVDRLQEFEGDLRRGPPGASVERLDVIEETPSSSCKGFRIRF
jgi:acylphosphatase